MDNKELPKLLEQLQREIEKTGEIDEKGRQMLHKLDEDIHKLLARSGNADRSEISRPSSTQPNVLHTLEETIAHLEATHPALTTLLSHMLETLSKAGI
jgi:hypothetical protein